VGSRTLEDEQYGRFLRHAAAGAEFFGRRGGHSSPCGSAGGGSSGSAAAGRQPQWPRRPPLDFGVRPFRTPCGRENLATRDALLPPPTHVPTKNGTGGGGGRRPRSAPAAVLWLGLAGGCWRMTGGSRPRASSASRAPLRRGGAAVLVNRFDGGAVVAFLSRRSRQCPYSDATSCWASQTPRPSPTGTDAR